VELALRTTLDENLADDRRHTCRHLHEAGPSVFLDAEHFFDSATVATAEVTRFRASRAACRAGAFRWSRWLIPTAA